jgi:uncharacterized protein (TIRG00374 family)
MRHINLKKLSKFIPIIGIVLLVYIIINIGVGKIANAFLLIPIHFFILAALPFILTLILGAYKAQYICKKQKMDLSRAYLIKLYLINCFYVTIIPGGIGSYIRIFYLKEKSKASIEKCLVNVFIDITTGFIIGFILALIGSIVLIQTFPEKPEFLSLILLILIFFIFYLTAFVVFMKKSGGKRLFKFFIRPLIPKNYKEKMDKSFESLYEDIPLYRDTIIPFLIEIVIWVIIALQVYIIATAFPEFKIPFHEFLLIHTIAGVAIIILPISIGGLGVREGAFVYILYNFYGIPVDIAFVISLSGFIVKMLIPAMLGMALSFKKKSIL